MSFQGLVPRSRLWLLGETLFASLLGLLPSIWTGTVTPDSVRKGIILGMLVAIPLEWVRENGGRAFLKSLRNSAVDPKLSAFVARAEKAILALEKATSEVATSSMVQVFPYSKPQVMESQARKVVPDTILENRDSLHEVQLLLSRLEIRLARLEEGKPRFAYELERMLNAALESLQADLIKEQNHGTQQLLASQEHLKTHLTSLEEAVAELRNIQERFKKVRTEVAPRAGKFLYRGSYRGGELSPATGEPLSRYIKVGRARGDEAPEEYKGSVAEHFIAEYLLRDMKNAELSEAEKLQRLRKAGGFSLPEARRILEALKADLNPMSAPLTPGADE